MALPRNVEWKQPEVQVYRVNGFAFEKQSSATRTPSASPSKASRSRTTSRSASKAASSRSRTATKTKSRKAKLLRRVQEGEAPSGRSALSRSAGVAPLTAVGSLQA